jgi:hypothetical protein
MGNYQLHNGEQTEICHNAVVEQNFTATPEDYFSVSTGAGYIIDFQKRCFKDVANHSLFLCGHSPDEVMELGYDFYSRIVHEDDSVKIIDKMIKNTTLKLLTICCFCIFYCNCNNSKEIPVPDAKYIIDIDKAEEKGVFYLSEIVKSVRPVRLEETDYALIGEIDEIQIFDNNIFVLDMLIAKKLFVYDMTGKYIRQIGTMGQGPDEYMGISYFCIDPDRKEIYLLDYWKNRLLKYRIEDGKLLDKINLPRSISYSDIAYVEGNIYADITHDDPDESDNLICKIDLKTGEFKEYISAETYNAGWNENLGSGFIRDNSLKYCGSYTNTVFICNKDGIYPYMSVKGKDWVRNGDIPAIKDDNMGIEDIKAVSEKGRAYGIHTYFENDTCIHFHYNKGKNIYHIVYNKQTQAVYRHQSTVNDINYSANEFVYNLVSVNSKFAYDIMRSNVVLSFLKKGKLSPELAKQVELLNLEEEGFVILEYELK